MEALMKQNKPNLSVNSLATYCSLLRNLYEEMFKTNNINLEKFKNTDAIIHHLNNDNRINKKTGESSPYTSNQKKTILSALLTLYPDDKLKKMMMLESEKYDKTISEQHKSQTQSKNWVNQDEVKEKWNELKKEADYIYKKAEKTEADLQKIQQFIILSLQSGIFIPPRRSLEWCEMVLNSQDKNYIDGNEFVFQVYKTAKTYGIQKVKIPRKLKTILTKWITINPTNYLLFDNNNNELTAVKLNQRFNKIFDKKVSTNMLRHSYLSTPDLQEHTVKSKKVKQIMTDMGSSPAMLQTYTKLD